MDLEERINRVFEILYVSKNYGENHTEFLFKEILEIITTSEDTRRVFIEAVKVSLFSEYVCEVGDKKRPIYFIPEELIHYVVHVTKWEEFSNIANSLASSNIDIDKGNPLVRSSYKILAALGDNWENRDFYEF